jgi:RimJ/RimL family protein N-acetyltransferase
MPRLLDPPAIRALLQTDRRWAVYALGDLAPGLFEKSEWYRPATAAPALALLYRGFGVPVLFALGAPEDVRPILEEFATEPQMHLHVRPEVVPLLRPRYEVRHEKTMRRMILDTDRYNPISPAGICRLGASDLAALQRLFADGEPVGEAPDFFAPSMLDGGVYYGCREGTELIAAAGTHLVAKAEGVAAVGCVYTRRDRRGRGHACQVTGAVAGELLRLGIDTVALNVHEHNAPAIRVYERLGFVPYCAFHEGLAVRVG